MKKSSPKEAMLLAGSVKHLELMRSIAKAIKTLFARPASEDGDSNGKITISLKQLEKVEEDFRVWVKSTMDFFAGGNGSDAMTRFGFPRT